MPAPRIAQLANFVGPSSGGMRVAVDALGRGYAAAGAARLLIVPGPEDAVRETDHGDQVTLRSPRVGGGYRLIVEPWRVHEILERFRPSAVELSDKTTLLPVARWARRRGLPATLLSHEQMSDMLAMRTRRETTSRVSIALLNRLWVRSVDRIVVTSEYARREFAPLVTATGCDLVRIPLGVDLDAFAPPVGVRPIEVRADDSDRPLRLVLAGRLSREKSPHLAVAVAVELHERGVPVRLDVLGDGPQRSELIALAGDAPVVFHGHLADRAEVARRLGAADVALSVCPGETFGLAVLEALACGTPVVTADRGGARELVDPRSGAWGPPRADALADAVLRLAALPDAQRRSGARARAELFPWGRTVEAMLALHDGDREAVAG